MQLHNHHCMDRSLATIFQKLNFLVSASTLKEYIMNLINKVLHTYLKLHLHNRIFHMSILYKGKANGQLTILRRKNTLRI